MKYRKHLRLAPIIYRNPGYFFVTVVSKHRRGIFTNQNKEVLVEILADIPNRFAGWRVDTQEIMPDHVHLILENTEADNVSLSRVIQAFKSISYHGLKKTTGCSEVVWQKNYYERVIRSGHELEVVRDYIRRNPEAEYYDWDKILRI